MRKIHVLCCVLLATLASVVHAQDNVKPPDPGKPAETVKTPESPDHYFHLEFVIQEVGSDGKPTNSRSYSTSVSSGFHQQFGAIRTGNRVPIITGVLPGSEGNNKLQYQYQYIDIGVNIDTRDVREIGQKLGLHLKAEVTSLAASAPAAGSELANDPVIRQNLWDASVVIPIGKPTIVSSSDALDNKGSMQLVVTATPLQ